MEYYIVKHSDYLEHHGIKGQRWGVRRFQYENGSYTPAGEKRYADVGDNYKKAKAEKKAANKEYTKAYNKAINYSYAHPVSQYFKKNKERTDAIYNDATNKAKAAYNADKAFKKAKETRKEALKSAEKDIRNSRNTAGKLLLSKGTDKRAAKYVVDNHMSFQVAKTKATGDAIRNTTIALGVIGAMYIGDTVARDLGVLNRR